MQRIYIFDIILVRLIMSLEQYKPTILCNDRQCNFCEATTEVLILIISISNWESSKLSCNCMRRLQKKSAFCLCNIFYMRARGIVVALRYKPEDRWFETRWCEWLFSIYLILPAALDPGVHSASKKNEYQKQKKKMILRSRARPVRGADNIAAICEPIAWTVWDP
jgi:hypothetical protein